MNKLLFIIFLAIITGGCSVLQPLQKRKLIGVFHLIETAKYSDAKIAAEELINDETSAQWPKTWYARGVLCQNAYREGIKKKDKKLFELYPDQLYVALQSFNKAENLDKSGRLEKQLAPRYILLANDFQAMGEKNFSSKKFSEALRAFEMALRITEKPVLAISSDTNLIFNAALAAYESSDWDKAVRYLQRLHNVSYSSNATHLLFEANLSKGDTIAAKKALEQGISRYSDNQDLVLLLADISYHLQDTSGALSTLENAIKADLQNHRYHYAKGLILQKSGMYKSAIESYREAIIHAPNDLMSHVNIATCYYNIGVEIDEYSRSLTVSTSVQEKKEKAELAFESAAEWLDKAYNKNPKDQEVLLRLYELYKLLRISEKADILKKRIE